MTTAASEAKPKLKMIVAPFGVEADAPRGNDVVVQSIPGCFLRGGLKRSMTIIDAKSGEEKMPKDQMRHLGSMPEIPGMQLHVSPAKRIVKIVDPLYEDEALCKRIYQALEEDERQVSAADRELKKVNGVPPREEKLDVDRMKTLCREIIWMLKADQVTMVKGPEPEMEDVDQLPGSYLLNPGSQVANMQPRYEKDLDNWVQNLARSGG